MKVVSALEGLKNSVDVKYKYAFSFSPYQSGQIFFSIVDVLIFTQIETRRKTILFKMVKGPYLTFRNGLTFLKNR